MVDAVGERFGSAMSPASIARVLADQGERLGHPEILQAYTRWREKQSFFPTEDLQFTSIDAAIRLINKVELLRQQVERDASMQDRLRQAVRSLKTALDSPATPRRVAP